MIAAERTDRIVELVNRNGSMSLADIAQELDTSESTIRRDLMRLHQQGRLRRVRGGAIKVTQAEFVVADATFAGRQELNMPEKRAIGALRQRSLALTTSSSLMQAPPPSAS